MIKKVKYSLIIIAFTLIGSCEEYFGPVVDCNDCFYDKPDSADLVINLTIDDQHPYVPITVFRGDIEEKQVDWVDTARETPYSLYSRVGQFYSIAAEYKVDGRTIIAVDGDELKSKHVSEGCEYECWVVTGGYLEVELKFD